MKRKRIGGFTVVELLIVIGIIGILTALILGATAQGRDKAKDNNIRSDVRQLQILAEGVFAQDATYTNWTSAVTDPVAITTLQNDIIEHYGSGTGATIQQSQVDSFCISSPLNGGGYFCVDDSKEFITTTGPCSGHQCP